MCTCMHAHTPARTHARTHTHLQLPPNGSVVALCRSGTGDVVVPATEDLIQEVHTQSPSCVDVVVMVDWAKPEQKGQLMQLYLCQLISYTILSIWTWWPPNNIVVITGYYWLECIMALSLSPNTGLQLVWRAILPTSCLQEIIMLGRREVQ